MYILAIIGTLMLVESLGEIDKAKRKQEREEKKKQKETQQQQQQANWKKFQKHH